MAKLSPQDAMSFYKHFYAPEQRHPGRCRRRDGRRGASSSPKKTYGKIPANPAVATSRNRPHDPPHRAARRVEYEDPRAGKASFHRDYVVPSYMTAKPGEAEALDLLMKIAADGATSRLYKAPRRRREDRLVCRRQLFRARASTTAPSASMRSRPTASSLDKIEASIDRVLAEVRDNGVTAAELERAKSSYIAEYIYENDDQASLARRYGWGLAVGPHGAADRRLAGRHLQGDAGRHQARRRDLPRLAPLGDGLPPSRSAGDRRTQRPAACCQRPLIVFC